MAGAIEPRTDRLHRELEELRAENARLRRLLHISGSTAPAPEQPTLGPVPDHALGLGPQQPTLPLEDPDAPAFSPSPPPPGPLTMRSPTAAKLAFYSRLFRCRTDTYARRWENARTGAHGWLPATIGPWRRGEPRDRQRLAPLTPQVVTAHLSGEETIGLYPMLDGDLTCWLAVDFDGPAAMVDALAYVKAARAAEVPVALEVSSSGVGAHVWAFFTDPVPATVARGLGIGLLHEAITLRGTMSLTAYDRLFPSQDVLATGGVGNLLAAPLQGERRRQGTTVFLDLSTLEPWPDQWAYLSTLDRLTPRQVTRTAEARRAVVGNDVHRLTRSRATAIAPALPGVLHVRLAEGVVLRGAELTPSAAATFRHAATMANPKFFELQRLRKSTWDTPRFVRAFDETAEGDLVLPRGLHQLVEDVAAEARVHLDVIDARDYGREIDVAFTGELTEAQALAVDAMLGADDGVLVALPGAGKTVMACALIAERATSTLVLVDRKALADQWRERIATHLGLRAGQLGGGRSKLTGVVDVAMLPTLARRPEEVADLTAGYGHVVVDECHHVGAPANEAAIKRMRPARWLGLTATPERRDRLEELVTWQLGPVRHVFQGAAPRLGDGPVAGPGAPTPRLVVHTTTYRYPGAVDPTAPGALAQVHAHMVADPERNRAIADDVAAAAAAGRHCLVLTRRVAHVDILTDLLRERGLDPVVMTGELSASERRAAVGRIGAMGERTEDGGARPVVVGTAPFIGEGFDAPVLDTLFLAAPISFPGVLVQAAGRILRSHPGKDEAVVHDYHDAEVPVLAVSLTRRAPGYRRLGFDMPVE